MFYDITLAYDEGECLNTYKTKHSSTRTQFVRILKISPNLYPLNSLQCIELLVNFSKVFLFCLQPFTAFGLGKFSLEIVFY